MFKPVIENGAMATTTWVLLLALTLAVGCDNGANNAAKPSAGDRDAADPQANADAAAADDATDTGAKIQASHERTGLDALPADIPSHHLTDYRKHLDKPAATGPHGGTLIKLNDQSSIELLLDRDSGRMTAYVLDAAGEPVAIKQDKIKLHIYWSSEMDPRDHEGFAELTAILRPTDDAVTPEGAAVFTAQDRDFARRPGQFIVKIEKLTVGDKTLDWPIYHFPAGFPWQPPKAEEAK